MSDSANRSEESAGTRMQCMEVWGGNYEVDTAFDMPGLRTWIYSKPYGNSDGGGDVYYVSSCASGRITRMLLADVSGHGAEVADLALGLRELMRKNVNVVKQTRFVEGMNRQFNDLANCGAFATALVATFFQPTKRLTLCNAGHPLPLHYDAVKGRWTEIMEPEDPSPSVSGTPLGVFDQAVYRQVTMPLEQNDLVLFFSDALTESCGPDGDMLGTEGLRKVVAQLDLSTPARIVPSLLDVIFANDTENLARDDLTVMLIQATGTATTLANNLLAPFRLFRSAADNTRLGGEMAAEPSIGHQR